MVPRVDRAAIVFLRVEEKEDMEVGAALELFGGALLKRFGHVG